MSGCLPAFRSAVRGVQSARFDKQVVAALTVNAAAPIRSASIRRHPEHRECAANISKLHAFRMIEAAEGM